MVVGSKCPRCTRRTQRVEQQPARPGGAPPAGVGPVEPPGPCLALCQARLRLALVEVLERIRLLRARKWLARRTTLELKQTGVATVSRVTRWRRRIALASSGPTRPGAERRETGARRP